MRNVLNVFVFVVMIFIYPLNFSYANNEPLEYQLALLDSDESGSRDELVAARFKSLLNQLTELYIEDREDIAHTTFAAKKMLKERGIEEKMLNIMEGINSIFYQKVENQKYKEYVAAYVTVRAKGMSHQDAIKGLKDIIKAIK
jgi:hypothetical protein